MRSYSIDFSALFGISLAIAMVVLAGSWGGNIGAFFDFSAVLIVVCGTLFLTSASYSLSELLRSVILAFTVIFNRNEHAHRVAMRTLGVADIARKNGILGLQKYINNTAYEPFFTKGLEMAADGLEEEYITSVMAQDVHATFERGNRSAAVLRKAAEISPAMGLIGTLVGLVQMLGNLNNPATIGPAMAVALLTTLYGAMLSYMVFSPLAAKLEKSAKEQALIMRIYQKTAESIVRQENPRRLEMVINSLLPPSERLEFFK